eukprot:101424_1
MAVGLYENSIWFIGGGTSTEYALVHFNITSQKFNQFTIPDPIKCTSQSYTVIGSIIYMSPWSTIAHIATFDMLTKTFSKDIITKPNNDTALRFSCVTNKNNDYLFVLGGSSNSVKTGNFSIFSFNTNTWISNGPSMPHTLLSFACNAHSNGFLYVIGGQDGSSDYSDVSIINITDMANINNQTWSTLVDKLYYKRRLLRSVVYNEFIYVIGGFGPCNSGNYIHCDTVDIIDTTTNTIRLDSHLKSAVMTTAAVVDLTSTIIYAFGGFKNGGPATDYVQMKTIITDSPTNIPFPTFSPSNPTNIPSRYPTNIPSQFPTIITNFPTFSPSIPTNIPSQFPTTEKIETVQAFSEELNKSVTNIFQFTVISICIFFIAIAFCAYIDARCMRKNDFFNINNIATAFVQTLDVISDVFFATDLLLSYHNILPGILATITIICPVIISLYQLYVESNKYWLKNNILRSWLSSYAKLLYFVSIITGSSFTAIQLFNSGMFTLQLFDMGLGKKERMNFKRKRVYSVVLIENTPQIILQGWYLYATGFNLIAVFSMIFSLISVIVSILSAVMEKKLINSQEFIFFSVDITGSNLSQTRSKCKNIVRSIKNEIAVILGLETSLIEIMKPQNIPQGLQLNMHIFVNNDDDDIDYEKLLNNAFESGQMGSIIQRSWKLKAIPYFSNMNYEKIQSKNSIRNTIFIEANNVSPRDTNGTATI